MRRIRFPARLSLVALTASMLALAVGTAAAPRPATAGGTPSFYCALDASCPEVMMQGDPFAQIGGNQAPFRGYGDPSLERDPDTGDIWLSYSWLDVLVSSPGPPPVLDLGVRTHLARSPDGGATFTFERALNATVPILHPDTSVPGWTIQEVSTLTREGPGAWQALWLTYFDPFGEPPGPEDRSDFYYTRSTASSPGGLGDSSTPWIRSAGTSASWGVTYNLSSMPQLADCAVLTEPALFTYGGQTYLASNCVVFSGGVRHPELERLVLLHQETNGYSYAGTLLDYADAVFLGGSRVEQADLSVAQNGAILLIVTPIQDPQAQHQGCVVLEVTDIATGQVRRDGAGDPFKLYEITGQDSTIGPGLCTYDAASDTGVLMVLHKFTPSPFDMEFSLRATGVHPQGVDTDNDGQADTVDTNDDNDMLPDATETACGSDPLNAASRPERTDGTFAGIDDDGDTQVDEPLPGGASGFDCDGDGYTGATEAHVFSATIARDQDACGTGDWPADLIGGTFSADKVNIQDLSTFIAPVRRLMTSPDDPGYDVRWDLLPGAGVFSKDVNIQDLTNVSLVAPPMLGGVRAFNGPVCPWPP